MRLKRIALRQFRNISSIDFEPGQGLNFFVGNNAQGKTSLLEGIFHISTLKSFRPASTQDLIRRGNQEAQVAAQLISSKDTTRARFLKIRMAPGHRQMFVDEKAVSPRQFLGQLRAVVFSPESLAAVKSGPDLRRELVDQAVFQISSEAPAAQSRFVKALRQRNACLRQIKQQEIGPIKGRALLESLDQGFLQAATEVTFLRLRFLDEIQPFAEEILSQIMGEECLFRPVYEGQENVWVEQSLKDIHERLKHELEDETLRVKEGVLGVSLVGPHRHDLSFLFNENDSRIFCSQGQQRALILSFKIAEIVYHGKVFDSYPLLLLDDVLSEFDEKKQRFLIDFLRTCEAQTFLTTTDQKQVLQGCSVFHIEAGQLKDTADSKSDGLRD